MDKSHDGKISELVSEGEPSDVHVSKPHDCTPSTPSARTGVPRSLAYISSTSSRLNSNLVETADIPPSNYNQSKVSPQDPYEREFYRDHSEFRNALDYTNPDQREKESEAMEKKERPKRRDSWLDAEAWKPRKWLSGLEDSTSSNDERQDPSTQPDRAPPVTTSSRNVSSSRTVSQPQSPKSLTAGSGPKWSRLRSLLPQVTGHTQGAQPVQAASSVAGTTVNITDELITGGLSALILRMWFERDERGARRIPILLHRLRIRVSDSLHPLHSTKAVFRIEVCAFLGMHDVTLLTITYSVNMPTAQLDGWFTVRYVTLNLCTPTTASPKCTIATLTLFRNSLGPVSEPSWFINYLLL